LDDLTRFRTRIGWEGEHGYSIKKPSGVGLIRFSWPLDLTKIDFTKSVGATYIIALFFPYLPVTGNWWQAPAYTGFWV
jgi:hypothetical protein